MSDLETRVAERSGEAALGDLPMIDTDRLQIPNLLQNLVSNAFKYRQREMSPAVIVSGYSQRTLRCDSTPQLMVRFRHEGLELCVFDISAATQQAQSTRRPAWALRFEDDQKGKAVTVKPIIKLMKTATGNWFEIVNYRDRNNRSRVWSSRHLFLTSDPDRT